MAISFEESLILLVLAALDGAWELLGAAQQRVVLSRQLWRRCCSLCSCLLALAMQK